ncbi:MAG: hypothetical protein A3D65_05560 [Candidatus Lloydbacteria bacterium RIFCSPHIGHO2_02_FULL_50_13]|uniref:Uncharacterized protein n=1 Tax=Candidatus Lloydbacteria bacterium RIFCSPHIGHO2_02_FULL_50_13 TaxID=1798661 RepID=A0A1G2D885_9BACT|nr:MAG: hypothetical protein A3D65_05560 [Candidatus Lloydbacteria bacterium RIFCSPHIGHO2_02_FULL_50_13]
MIPPKNVKQQVSGKYPTPQHSICQRIVIRKYEKRAMTPYERVMAREDVTPDAKEKLRNEHEPLNPLQLLQQIATVKEKIYQQQKARNREATR